MTKPIDDDRRDRAGIEAALAAFADDIVRVASEPLLLRIAQLERRVIALEERG